MKQDPTRVLIVAESDVLAATIEAALRDKADLDIAVSRPRALGRLIEEHEPAATRDVVCAAGRRGAGVPPAEAQLERRKA